ncbi:hypothetical protein BN1723_020459, partial [Verticillium longisporum]
RGGRPPWIRLLRLRPAGR